MQMEHDPPGATSGPPVSRLSRFPQSRRKWRPSTADHVTHVIRRCFLSQAARRLGNRHCRPPDRTRSDTAGENISAGRSIPCTGSSEHLDCSWPSWRMKTCYPCCRTTAATWITTFSEHVVHTEPTRGNSPSPKHAHSSRGDGTGAVPATITAHPGDTVISTPTVPRAEKPCPANHKSQISCWRRMWAA